MWPVHVLSMSSSSSRAPLPSALSCISAIWKNSQVLQGSSLHRTPVLTPVLPLPEPLHLLHDLSATTCPLPSLIPSDPFGKAAEPVQVWPLPLGLPQPCLLWASHCLTISLFAPFNAELRAQGLGLFCSQLSL